jgi:hypothetical protein
LTCTDTAPAIDGVFQITEWGNEPLFSFQPVNSPSRLVQVYSVRDSQNLYLAFLINDESNNASDSLRLYFDTTNNGGDPDTADRFFQIARDGTMAVWAGIGSNTDTRTWNSEYSSGNWEASIGEPGSNQWVVEMEIDILAEMSALADPFGLMVQVLYTGDLATWPEGGLSNVADTWQDVDNADCP